jgi:hypothetical protein
MAKKRNRKRRPAKAKASVSTYADAEGNQLVLRQALSPATVEVIREETGNQAADVDDIWQRRTELLFERLAVSWEIAGLGLDDQAMLLGRYRMADSETRRWVRETVNEHVQRFIPELDT